jgi:hypothetical protein
LLVRAKRREWIGGLLGVAGMTTSDEMDHSRIHSLRLAQHQDSINSWDFLIDKSSDFMKIN